MPISRARRRDPRRHASPPPTRRAPGSPPRPRAVALRAEGPAAESPAAAAARWAPFLFLAGALFSLVMLSGCRSTGTTAGPSPGDDPGRYARQAAERFPALEICRPPGSPEDMLCGTLEVWEDREAQAGRKIGLAVVVVPSRSATPQPDPFVPIAGGPGGGITDAAGGALEFAGPILEDRDVLLLDQRGTGRSHPLNCDLGVSADDPASAFPEEMYPLDAIRRCREELEKTSDLTLYTTSIAADDLEEVRQRLGFGPLNLSGGSYGTRLAQDFLRRHPGSVRTAMLNGLAGLDQRMPLHHASDGQRSMEMIFALCAEDPACGEAFPDLDTKYRTVLDRLEEAPGRATLEHPETDEPLELTVTRGLFAEAMRSHLYQVITSTEVPLLIQRAYEGDFEPFFQATLPWRTMIETSLAHGLYLSITCAEDTTRYTQAEADRLNRGTYLGSYRTDAQSAACREWPVAEVPHEFFELVETDLPVLIIDGDLDPVTPPHWAERAVEPMDNGLLVVIPGGHHGFDGLTNQECLDGLMERFLDEASVDNLDPSCVETMERPAFVLEEEDMLWARWGAER